MTERPSLVRISRTILLASVAAATLLGCQRSDARDATIDGVVLRGPMCPVESASSPCPDQPYAGVEVHAAVEGDMVVDSDVTDANGRFRLEVTGGVSYRVSVLVEPPEQPQAERVLVPVGGTAQVTLHVDTGIR